jgi:cell division protein FtsQ
MSNEKTTSTRSDAVRRRREQTTKTETRKPRSVPAVTSRRSSTAETPRRAPSSGGRRRLSIATSLAATQPRSFGRSSSSRSIELPQIEIGLRWLSGLIVIACAGLLYMMWTMDPFIVRGAEVYGASRLSVNEVNSALGLMNQSIVLANTENLEYNLRTIFPDLSSATVTIAFPANIIVTIVERQPVITWAQDNQTLWIDADGFAFQPRGVVDGLLGVSAVAAPPAPVETDLTQTFGARPFVAMDTVRALQALAPYVPQGSALIYDPKYGLGWNDPRGWMAYFGSTTGDMPLKLQVYQALVDSLIQQNIDPSVISVEYPHAPFYRTEQ